MAKYSQCVLFLYEDLERQDTAELNQKDNYQFARETECDTTLPHYLIPLYGDQQIWHL